MGCGCGKDKGEAMNNNEDFSAWVDVDYFGVNSGPITYTGYDKRKYLASRSGVIYQGNGNVANKVHPDDLAKLKRFRRQNSNHPKNFLFDVATVPVVAPMVVVDPEPPEETKKEEANGDNPLSFDDLDITQAARKLAVESSLSAKDLVDRYGRVRITKPMVAKMAEGE